MTTPTHTTGFEKKEQVRHMFDSIAGRYDFLNHFLSFGIDKIWRKKIVKMIAKEKPGSVLDVATGTADLAIALTKRTASPVTGIDLSQKMLEIGIEKVAQKGLDRQITLSLADSEDLPFPEASFDAAMVAFGVRNFEDLQKGLQEMYRILSAGGMIGVLEFSMPRHFPVKQIYRFYFRYLLPAVGRWISKDPSAYTYLPESVDKFPNGKKFLNELEKAGFVNPAEKRLSFGIASIYTAYKSVENE
ncbi:MAG: bifunctional demethylmenaquinone methyltransferase/2-methoxy-6-polyprenyl-1,4-benzoquinol methylase UbiE [Bacteroidales bacterium]|nr:bifunctional demethylmenaquinone methyltransferase/2-methoxy-6-polyprenyl-1,4-benzoquinol methylase UbiE [Bacteroidales bacterium]